ncbi:hypothetical protein ACLEPN_41330 [Myxococcus sp. 1LA]
MTTRRTLRDLMEAVSGRHRNWASPQDLGFDRVMVAAAWLASDDPLAMLLLLAAVHPHRLSAAWRVTEDTRWSRLEPELAAAIRVVVPDPFTLVGPVA